ncbi:MAG: response regulator transcription factor [Candidatus Acidiferrales bacterium]|jgi:DNA-binding NarL/FixJ family response regulator
MTLRIFIVDDSDRVRGAIKSLLASHSDKWQVCGEAADGDDAVERAAAAMPDVILLDLSLPQVHGSVLAIKLRDAIPSATIVIMSAQDPRLMREFADSYQIEYFTAKSNLGTDLIASLEKISRKKQSSV